MAMAMDDYNTTFQKRVYVEYIFDLGGRRVKRLARLVWSIFCTHPNGQFLVLVPKSALSKKTSNPFTKKNADLIFSYLMSWCPTETKKYGPKKCPTMPV